MTDHMESYISPDDEPKPVKVKAVAPAPEEGLLTDPHRVRGDIELTQMAINRGWDVTPEERKIIKARAMKIVKKESVVIGFDKDDQPLVADGKADDNAIKASALVVSMASQDQADRHLEDKNKRIDGGKATENVTERIIRVEFDKKG